MYKISKDPTLFSIEEAAKWCGLSRNAFYQHYYRGHIKRVPLSCHRLWFSRAALDEFRSLYCPFIEE